MVPLSNLFKEVFGSDPASGLLDPAILAWKYWDTREDWSGPRGYVLEDEHGITAHAGIWPVSMGDKDPVRGIQMIDWCSSPRSPGAGVSLVQKLAARFDFIYSIGGSDQTRRVLPALKFVEAVRVWTAARPLRPFRQALTHQAVNWKLPARFIRNWLWSTPPAEDTQGWSTRAIKPSDIRWPSVSSAKQVLFSPRSPCFFEYLLRHPRIRWELHMLSNRDTVEGYFALGVVRGQARVAGVWLCNPNQEHWRIAYSLAQQAAVRVPEAYEIAAMGSMGPSGDAAAQSGMHIMRSTPVYLLNKTGRFILPNDFQFQMSDDDAAFLDIGRPCYFT